MIKYYMGRNHNNLPVVQDLMNSGTLPYISATIIFSTRDKEVWRKISQITNIKPTKVGEMVDYCDNLNKKFFWEFEVKANNQKDIMNPLRIIISAIEKEDFLIDYVHQKQVEVNLVIVIHGFSTELPQIVLEKQAISFAERLNAEIGFDIYAYLPEENI